MPLYYNVFSILYKILYSVFCIKLCKTPAPRDESVESIEARAGARARARVIHATVFSVIDTRSLGLVR